MALDRNRRRCGCRGWGSSLVFRCGRWESYIQFVNGSGAGKMIFRRLLILTMVFQMTMPQAWAVEKRASSLPRIAVTEFPFPPDLLSEQSSARDAFAKAFARTKKFEVVSRDELEKWKQRRKEQRGADYSKLKVAQARE